MVKIHFSDKPIGIVHHVFLYNVISPKPHGPELSRS
jgi:hypothetical protein